MLLNHCKNMLTKFPAGESWIFYRWWLHRDQNKVITKKNQYQSGWQCVSILDCHLICDHNCLQNIWTITGLQGRHRHHCPWHVDDQTWLCLTLVQHSFWGTSSRIWCVISVLHLSRRFLRSDSVIFPPSWPVWAIWHNIASTWIWEIKSCFK